jgi:hypothetical protein
MKTLFLILFTFFSLRLSSQVTTLTSYKSETLFKEGNYIDSNFTQILNTESVFSSYGKITKVLDLDFGSALLIEDGNLINTLKIKSHELKNGVYFIVLDDTNIFTGEQLDTYQIIDTNNNFSYFYWFYSDVNESWLINEKIDKILIE